MLNFLKKKTPPPPTGIRDTLFGDMPIDAWIANDTSSAEPWASFAEAQRSLRAGHKDSAIATLTGIANRTGIEPRHTLEAWHALQALGVSPPESIAKKVYGVVVEVAMDNGVDLVAAYTDHSARYYNFSGSGVVWEAADSSLDAAIDSLLAAGQLVADQIGPWTDERPPAPEAGQARINMLTPSGLHFGQAPFEALAGDALGGPVITAALGLMQGLIGKVGSKA